MLNHHSTCSNLNCKNPVFGDLDKCVLHCEKEKDSSDMVLLLEFLKFLKKYIISQKEDRIQTDIKESSDDEKFHAITRNNSLRDKIQLNNIYFPEVGKDFDYMSLIDNFKIVSFVDCHFYNKKINNYIESSKNTRTVFFDTCVFYNDFLIYPFKGWTEKDTIFYKCTFIGKLTIEKSDKLNLINCDIFVEGIFHKEVIISDIDLDGKIFNQHDDLKDTCKIEIHSDFKIINCNFEKKITLNNLKIKKLSIENSVFKDKLEIKDGNFEEFEFKNSNVLKVFTAQNSKFVKFSMRESIFEDFAGFEKVHFGAINNEDEKFISDFTYTTFKSFSNFREAVFHSGLDLSRINLKEQPNFFKVNIKDVNVNRETYRIIKNSFDKNGNHIVANDYFIMEMKAYRKEIKKEIDIKGKLIIIKSEFLKIKTLDKSNIKNFILIFKKNLSEIYNNNKIYKKIVIDLNDAISGFGDNYIRPIRILTLSIILYNLCFLMQKYYAFDESDSIIFCIIDFLNQSSKSFLIFSNFLKDRQGIEFISLLFYIWFSILIWQIVVAIKRHTIR